MVDETVNETFLKELRRMWAAQTALFVSVGYFAGLIVDGYSANTIATAFFFSAMVWILALVGMYISHHDGYNHGFRTYRSRLVFMHTDGSLGHLRTTFEAALLFGSRVAAGVMVFLAFTSHSAQQSDITGLCMFLVFALACIAYGNLLYKQVLQVAQYRVTSGRYLESGEKIHYVPGLPTSVEVKTRPWGKKVYPRLTKKLRQALYKDCYDGVLENRAKHLVRQAESKIRSASYNAS